MNAGEIWSCVLIFKAGLQHLVNAAAVCSSLDSLEKKKTLAWLDKITIYFPSSLSWKLKYFREEGAAVCKIYSAVATTPTKYISLISIV